MFEKFEVSVDLIALTAFVIATMAYIYNKMVKPVINKVSSMMDASEKIDVIYAQMFTNGGSTLRDAINRIEEETVLLKKRQEIYILDHDHGILETDKLGSVVFVNRTMCKMADKTERDLMGFGWVNSVCDDDRGRVLEALEFSIENEVEFSMIFSLDNGSGGKLKVRGRFNPVKTNYGVLLNYIGVIELL